VAELLEEIRSRCAVAVHVRRGDYVRNARTNEFHGLCTPEYYQAAAKYVVDRIDEPTFLVFSDEPEWVQANLKLGRPTIYVTHDGNCAPHHDMWLMSQCSHHIIANSSFSWWGAWLCRNEKKMVVAPKRWFRDPKVNTSDLIPECWITI
jgi:hypothetical protein